MAYRAKEVLKLGFVTVAVPGNVVHATAEEVARNGWTDKVEEVRDAGTSSPDGAAAGVTPDPNRPAGA